MNMQTHTKCPICDKRVLILSINEHLDGKDCGAPLLFPEDENVFEGKSPKGSERINGDEHFSSHFKRSVDESESGTQGTKRPKLDESSLISDNNDERIKPYYLANWETIIRGVLEECPDDASLFTSEEKSLATTTFRSLSFNAQKLYVRLFQRKWTWIPIHKISYSEIHDVPSQLNELISKGFLQNHSQLADIPTVLHLLPAPEVKKLCKAFNIDSKLSAKKDVSRAFDKLIHTKSFFNKSGVNEVLRSKVLKKGLTYLDPCFILSDGPRTLFNRLLSLHSLTRFYEDRENGGNSNMTLMLLANRGDVTFPTYDIKRKTPIFRSREGLLAFETAMGFEARISELFEGKSYKEITENHYPKVNEYFESTIMKSFAAQDAHIPDFLRKFTAGGIIVYCLSKCAEAFEKIRDYKTAVRIYELCLSEEQVYNKEFYSGHWYERLSLDCEQWLKKREKALEHIIRSLSCPFVSPARKLGLCMRIKKMQKHLGDDFEAEGKVSGWMDPEKCESALVTQEIQGSMLDKDLSGGSRAGSAKSIFVFEKSGEDREKLFCSVEEFTVQYYKEEFPYGIHGEGSVISSIVFLLFWDIIYDTPVPDAFRGPYQSSPLDLGSINFYESREELIQSRLDLISECQEDDLLTSLLSDNWNKGEGTSSLVHWDLFSDLNNLLGLIKCFSPAQLSAICARLLKRNRFYRSGFPDLTLWDPSRKALRFVEVKGPGDRLSTKQIIWLNFLNEIGVDAVVCYVQASGSKKCLS